ncbi:FAD-binding oxidoreductase [Bradyrhizobium sp. U87765 SZCCT0131]|uniref:NAD(P)/FAD-dependent oxidoreductase n=1 Tax=unclassified Bradyrhizobium TaxID=2631580 RepID=UPI001BA4EAB7|nr:MULTISPECIES: FAD-dependent oxidoreductase [unclassified Bradyrhizobium]MBR1217848.1 FAD-binding oxidoreductase [Bradyrhizobium sp. U87765 SZCCT0131]MBR1261206.1 FAD-binding oxidoreductase [Bradyrhizobium sp. U87765 SZCCT0134]MBR1303346.1 FAD-binding oxidoreductase [Bradyrhizobium sp. U87765 SZCCT0110]MBR1318952.1 FAD-binding oxidoreductase [Bradyrhizobium sp. U87765 SZCCT0109]MBR1347277.1 FAD-binding oxidoreductase [Bradyrhizobium sp. U87765 SZCCT0048]
MTGPIAIVGGGIVGCLLARELLAARADLRIVLLERDLVGLGASQRSAGVHFPFGRTERLRAMTRFSEQYYADLGRRNPHLPLFPVDFVAAAPGAAAVTAQEWFTTAAAGDVPPSRRVGLSAWPPDAALWMMPGCHHADVGALARSLATDLRQHITLLEGVDVTAVNERGDGVALELSTGETLRAEKVVLAPGPWVNAAAWRHLTAPLGVRVKKIVALHLDRAVRPDAAAVFFPQDDAFIVPLKDRGHWLYSYTCTEWDLQPDDIHGGLTERNLADGRAILARYDETLASSLRSGRVFCDAYSPMREPLVTTVGELGHIVFAGAANGSGYRLAPAIAREVVQLLNLEHGRGVLQCAS